MSLCFLSRENNENGFVLIDNKFITDFMPSCTQMQLNVYLYGLYLCNQTLSPDNTIDNICDHLSITQEEVTGAYTFLSTLGLITIIKDSPLQVRYEKIKEFNSTKKFSKEKYADFNQQYLSIFEGVSQVNPNAFLVYYEFMEETKISPEVMIMIIRFCVSKKGEKISFNYILTVARDWVSEGVRTLGAVENKIMQMEANTESLILIAKELGKFSENTLEDKQLYLKWTSSWGFDLQSILTASKLCKRKGGMARLDKLLDELFKVNCKTSADIEAYSLNKQKIYDNVYIVNKKLGLWIENVEIYVEKYFSEWLNSGFDLDAIQDVADFCFTSNVKSYEGMNAIMQKFKKAGCTDKQSISQYVAHQVQVDDTIRQLIVSTGSSRGVSNSDRDLYKIWTFTFGFNFEIINYACSLALGKPYAFGFANNILSKWKTSNVSTLDEAKNFVPTDTALPNGNATKSSKASAEFNSNDRKYTKEDLSSFFDDLTDLDNIEV